MDGNHDFDLGCRGCEKRTPECHGHCTHYKALKAFYTHQKQLEYKASEGYRQAVEYEKAKGARLHAAQKQV